MKISLKIILLSYLNYHKDTPYDSKTLFSIVRTEGYRASFVSTQLASLKQLGYVSRTDTDGVIYFTHLNLARIKEQKPELAKVINEKLYPMGREWQG